MRKVVAYEFISLDGVIEAPDQWHFPYFDEEMGEAVGEGFAASDAMLMGRVNYEGWAAYWPEQDPEENPIADTMNSKRKYVVSTTLEEPLEWNNSTLIKGNEFAEEIAKLKEQEGKDIAISGGPILVRSLLDYGLLDELRLFVHPIVVGSGRRLFEDGGDQIALELADSRTFSSGTVYLTYRPTGGRAGRRRSEGDPVSTKEADKVLSDAREQSEEASVRRIVVSEFVSLDGVVEDPRWTFRFMSEERERFKLDELAASDALLLGRVTYEGFAAAWPRMNDEGGFAERMNGYPKHVVSTTLQEPLEWNNSTLIKGDVVEGIADLKRRDGKDIAVHGSAALVRTLMEHDLVDELRLMVFPIVVGKGKRLFGDAEETKAMDLVEAKPLGPNGVIVLIYRPAGKEVEG
jgi:dihydrofolate reductase